MQMPCGSGLDVLKIIKEDGLACAVGTKLAGQGTSAVP